MHRTTGVRRIHEAVHHRILFLLVGAYALAAVAPAPGLLLRAASVGSFTIGSVRASLTLPTLLLGALVFNASLGVRLGEVRTLRAKPAPVLVGVAGNTVLPVLFAVVCSALLRFWHNYDEVENLLVGFAIVGAMPIAGSSSAWAQNAEGNLALSVGLVLASTIASPLLTPFAFRIVAAVTSGDYAEDLLELAGAETQVFLVITVVLPMLLAAVARWALGSARVAPLMAPLKLSNQLVILLLNYMNGAVALPTLVRAPDPDFLALLVGCAVALCVLSFLAGHGLGRLLRAARPERVSLMFAFAMSNNGTGLALASTALADHPNVLLTILAYNLVQQVAAGSVDRYFLRAGPERIGPNAA